MLRLLMSAAAVLLAATLRLQQPQAPADYIAPLFQSSQKSVNDARLPGPLYPDVVALWDAGKPVDALAMLEQRVRGTDGDTPLEALVLRARLSSAAGQYEQSASLWEEIRGREKALDLLALREQVDNLIRARQPERAEELLGGRPARQFGDLLAMIATTYRVAGRFDRATSLYRHVVADPPSGAVGDEAWLGLAATFEQAGNSPSALSVLRDLQLRFRLVGTFTRARAQTQHLASAINTNVEPYTEQEYQSLTDRLLNFSAYDDALAVLDDWRRAYPGSASRVDALIVDTLYRARKDDQADARAAAFLEKYPDSSRVPDLRVLQYRLDIREGRTASARSRGRALWTGQVPGISLADRFSLGRLLAAYLVSVGQLDEGLNLYQQLYRTSSSRDMRIDVLWRASVAAIRAGKLDRAEQDLALLRRLKPGPDTLAIADYWTAIVRERRNRRSEAIQILTALAVRAPYDYYGIRARERLAALNAPIPTAQPRMSFPSLTLPDASRARDEFRGAVLLARAGLKTEAAQMARALAADVPNNPGLTLLAARASANANDHRQAVRLVERRFNVFLERPGNGVPDDFWTLAYPHAFWDAVRPAAESEHVDPFLLLSLARQESRFDPTVRSPVGALGLFQIMPYTADELGPGLGISVNDRSVLLQPRTSSAFAARLVGDLLKQFDDDAVAVMAAYNAGEDRAKDWWKAARRDSEDLFVDTIPYTETRTYVRTVYSNYVRYQQLYGGTSLLERRPSSPKP
jgi:soluble lytic murein transglycosylase